MKLVSILCLSLSLAAPTAANLDNVKNCEGVLKKDDRTGIGKTQVRIFCKGKAEDFGGASGDETTIDCFNSTQTKANDIYKEDCKSINVQIKYKMGNAMSGDNKNEGRDPEMYLFSAAFGQGQNKKNVGNEDFTDVTSSVNPPTFGDVYPPSQYTNHKYNATVNQCAEDGGFDHQFFMKMRLKPFKHYVDEKGVQTGFRGTEGQDGAVYDFYTSKCGTNDKIKFSIVSPTSAPSPALPTPTAPKPSPPTDAPQAATTAAPQANQPPTEPDVPATPPAPQAAPTDAPQPAPPKKGGKGSSLSSQAAVPQTVPTAGKGGKGSLKTKSSPKRRLRKTN